MKILGNKIQEIFKGFADCMAFTFVVLSVAWNLGMPFALEYALYVAGYGFSAYTIKRIFDLLDEVQRP